MKKLPYEELTAAVIRAFYDVYNEIGPGLSEGCYHRALMVALQHAGIPFTTEERFPVLFRGVQVGLYRADLVVAGTVVVEVKTGRAIAKDHIRQVLYYLYASKLPVGMLLNFGETAEFRRIER